MALLPKFEAPQRASNHHIRVLSMRPLSWIKFEGQEADLGGTQRPPDGVTHWDLEARALPASWCKLYQLVRPTPRQTSASTPTKGLQVESSPFTINPTFNSRRWANQGRKAKMGIPRLKERRVGTAGPEGGSIFLHQCLQERHPTG